MLKEEKELFSQEENEPQEQIITEMFNSEDEGENCFYSPVDTQINLKSDEHIPTKTSNTIRENKKQNLLSDHLKEKSDKKGSNKKSHESELNHLKDIKKKYKSCRKQASSYKAQENLYNKPVLDKNKKPHHKPNLLQFNSNVISMPKCINICMMEKPMENEKLLSENTITSRSRTSTILSNQGISVQKVNEIYEKKAQAIENSVQNFKSFKSHDFRNQTPNIYNSPLKHKDDKK